MPTEKEKMKGKGNDGKGDTVERDLWKTQQKLFDLLDKQYNFTFDCCANEVNHKCSDWSNDFEKSSVPTENEDMIAWMNPPFSKANQMFEHFFKVVKKGVAIFRCDNMETKVWQEIILKNAEWIFIPKGRVSYTPFEVGNMRGGNGTRFPSALIGIGVNIPIGLEGKILFIRRNEEKCQLKKKK
jgi:hypothetical protein